MRGAAGSRRVPPLLQRVRVATALIAFAALAAGCGGTPSAGGPPEGSRPVSFPASDGVRLEGRLFGESGVGVVLSHMRPADQASWYEFASRLAGDGYLALTFNFRGYCPGGEVGCSEGSRQISAIWQDVMGAVEFIRSRGARDVVLIGASMGGTASLAAAAQPGVDPVAVVTLSAPLSIEGLVAGDDVLAQVGAAKLFLAGVGDAAAASDAEDMYNRSGPPKRVEILPSDDHGTDLLTGNQAEIVRNLVLTHLEVYAPVP